MSEIRRAISAAGMTDIARGDVRIVRNDDLVWTRGQPATSTTHRVVVIGREDLLQDPKFPVAKVVPCTTTPQQADGLLEVKIPEGEGAFTKENVYAITYLEQPLHKEKLGERVGTVSADTLSIIEAGIVDSLGIPGDE